jgi:hypothetical protein
LYHSANNGKIDDNRTRFALSVFDGEMGAIAGLQLGQQRQGIVIIAKAHRFADLQRIERTKNGGMAETLGNAARIEGVKGFGSRAVAGMNGVNGLHVSSRKYVPGWHQAAIVPAPFSHFLDPDRNNPCTIMPSLEIGCRHHSRFADWRACSSAF